jgi:hypothetical protein
MIGCITKLTHGKHLTNSQLNDLLIGDLASASKATELPQDIATKKEYTDIKKPTKNFQLKMDSDLWTLFH